MLTYALEKNGSSSLYTQLYGCIRRDILSGALPPRQKLPSKRALAQHLEVSVITVKNAYEQLAAEGYIYTVEKKGYYVSPLESPLPPAAPPPLVPERPAEPVFLDLATGSLDRSYFPFTVWSRLMRQTILEEDTELLRSTPYNGAPALRRAIAAHLRQFRAMDVDPEQIIIGAGTELLYTLIIQLLGRDKRYAVEDPGYGKIAKIYQAPIRLVRNARTYAGKCGLLLARKHAHGHYLPRKGKEAFAAAEFGIPHGAGGVCIGLCALRRGKGGKLLQRGYAPLNGRIAKLSG